MFYNKETGNIGESLAVNHLKKNGYKIIERNYKNKIGEIDIIAKKDDTIIFVEVKMRKNTNFGLPQEAVDSYKQRKIRNVATYYLKSKNLYDRASVRFDCIAIIGDKLDYKLSHLENIF